MDAGHDNWGLPLLRADRLVVADDFRDDEVQEFLGEIRIELGGLGELAKARDLGGLARRIGGRQAVLGLVAAHRLRALEALGQDMDQRRVDVVDAVAQAQELWIGHGPGFRHLLPNFFANPKNGPSTLKNAVCFCPVLRFTPVIASYIWPPSLSSDCSCSGMSR